MATWWPGSTARCEVRASVRPAEAAVLGGHGRRARRFEAAIAVCTRLWAEDVIEHHGEFFDFPPVMFEPKPVQKPHPPVLVGGESDRARERAARLGDGWIGMHHTPESVALPVKKLRDHLGMYPEKRDGFTITCSGLANHPDDVQAWSHAGVDRL